MKQHTERQIISTNQPGKIQVQIYTDINKQIKNICLLEWDKIWDFLKYENAIK